MAFLNSALFSQHINTPTIFDQFPELNQGKQYLQNHAKVKRRITKTQKFIESFSPYNKKGILKKCGDQTQDISNNTPCRCGNVTCTSSTPYCNYQLNTCTGKGANINLNGEMRADIELFSESNGRWVVQVAPGFEEDFRKRFDF